VLPVLERAGRSKLIIDDTPFPKGDAFVVVARSIADSSAAIQFVQGCGIAVGCQPHSSLPWPIAVSAGGLGLRVARRKRGRARSGRLFNQDRDCSSLQSVQRAPRQCRRCRADDPSPHHRNGRAALTAWRLSYVRHSSNTTVCAARRTLAAQALTYLRDGPDQHFARDAASASGQDLA